MASLNRMLDWPVTSDKTDVHIGQLVCFISGPVAMVMGLIGVSRFAASPGELVIGVIASCVLGLQLVTLGFVLPSGRRE